MCRKYGNISAHCETNSNFFSLSHWALSISGYTEIRNETECVCSSQESNLDWYIACTEKQKEIGKSGEKNKQY